MITDRRGRKRRFIYEPQGRFATPADIPSEIALADRKLDGDLAPGKCALRRGKIVVQHVQILGQSVDEFDPRDFTQRVFAYITSEIGHAFRQGMVAATKLRRAR